MRVANAYVLYDNYAEIILYDKEGNEKARKVAEVKYFGEYRYKGDDNNE